MKYVVVTVVSALILMLIMTSIMFITNRSQREAELDNAVSASCREALEEVYMGYGIYPNREEGDEAIKVLFEKKLNERIVNGDGEHQDNNLKLDIDYKAIDSVEGLMSVDVTEHYTNIGGSIGEITRSSTVLVDEESSKIQYNISYMVDGRLYRSYNLNEGDKIIVPDFECSYWEDEEGNRPDEDYYVTDNKVYDAVFV